jgi:hypothetical protein
MRVPMDIQGILEGVPGEKCWIAWLTLRRSKQHAMSEYQSRAEHVHRVEVQLSIQGSLYTFSFLETMTFAGKQQITGRNLNMP